MMIHVGKQVPVIKRHEPDYKSHAAEQVFVFEPGWDVIEKLQDREFMVFSLWFIVYRSSGAACFTDFKNAEGIKR